MPIDIDLTSFRHGTELLKRGFAKMQKGGVIMDVVTAEQARIAEDAGAVAVMSLERVPSDIRAMGGVARAADPTKLQEILDEVSIPVMAKVRIGHFTEARIWESMGADMIDESEVLTPADPYYHINKSEFTVPFVCGCTYLGEAVRRIAEGAAMIRTKGEAGTGNVVEAVRHMHLVNRMIENLKTIDEEKLNAVAHTYALPFGKLESATREEWCDAETAADAIVFGGRTLADWEADVKAILIEIRDLGRLPVVNFAAGGIATPADASLMMSMGCDGVFVGSGIFKSSDPQKMAKSIADAVTNYEDAKTLTEVSMGLGNAMPGLDIGQIPDDQILQNRGL